MRVDTFKCDVCGLIKGDNNHWFRIDTAGHALALHAWGAVETTASTLDLCSDECVIKTVQQWLSAQARITNAKLAGVRVTGEALAPERHAGAESRLRNA